MRKLVCLVLIHGAGVAFGIGNCATPPYPDTFHFVGQADGVPVEFFENQIPQNVSMTATAAITVCRRADGSIYFIIEEYMNRGGTRLTYQPISPLDASANPLGYFDSNPALAPGELLVLKGLPSNANQRDFLRLKWEPQGLRVTYWSRSRGQTHILASVGVCAPHTAQP